jgi:hypothetical protein
MYLLSALFVLAQAPTRVGYPLWVVIVAPSAAAIIAALATVAATSITLSITRRREQERQVHEEKMQKGALKSQRQEAWRVERKQAYAAFLASARSARATREDEHTSDDSKEALLKNLREAHATVALVGETDALRGDAEAYYQVCKRILRGKDPSELNGYKDARNAFLRSARAELGLPPQPSGENRDRQDVCSKCGGTGHSGQWPDYLDELKVQFVEVGDWARHYSNVRATVAPVLAALSLGILQFAIEKSGESKLIPAVSSALLWFTALFILFRFTHATKNTMKHWLYIQNLLFPNPPSDESKVFLHERATWDSSNYDRIAVIGLGLTAIYAIFCGLWFFEVTPFSQNP